MKIIFIISYSLIVCLATSLASNEWPNHDISTLRLLQIVHRHGERSPVIFAPNDPFQNQSYWPEGLGELTAQGKYRLYKLGQFIRNEYNPYLGDKYSPREVYARSASTERCIESVSCLLSGAYPPKQHDWQWNNGSDAELGAIWQPFPIETFIPNKEDLVLEQGKRCLAVNKEREKIFNRPEIKAILEQNNELYENVSALVGKGMDTMNATYLYDALKIEMDHNYYWSDIWSNGEEERIVDALHSSYLLYYRYEWDSDVIKRLRAGGLVRELNENIENVLNGKTDKKVFVYSTHDTLLAVLMHALGIYNEIPPHFGAALLLELHENKDSEYFVKIYYKNEKQVNTETPEPLEWSTCHNKTDCPLNDYKELTKHLLYEDFDKECNEKF